MPDAMILLAGGRIVARRCHAKCKATQQQCRCPAVKGYEVCRVHGSRGGPKTSEGRARCAKAKTVHGRETRAIREKAAQSTRRIRATKLAIRILDNEQKAQLTREEIAALIREVMGD
jgi:hypothetical protein